MAAESPRQPLWPAPSGLRPQVTAGAVLGHGAASPQVWVLFRASARPPLATSRAPASSLAAVLATALR
eukprot:7902987-Alexandrium_andersonii.AAC.1